MIKCWFITIEKVLISAIFILVGESMSGFVWRVGFDEWGKTVKIAKRLGFFFLPF